MNDRMNLPDRPGENWSHRGGGPYMSDEENAEHVRFFGEHTGWGVRFIATAALIAVLAVVLGIILAVTL